MRRNSYDGLSPGGLPSGNKYTGNRAAPRRPLPITSNLFRIRDATWVENGVVADHSLDTTLYARTTDTEAIDSNRRLVLKFPRPMRIKRRFLVRWKGSAFCKIVNGSIDFIHPPPAVIHAEGYMGLVPILDWGGATLQDMTWADTQGTGRLTLGNEYSAALLGSVNSIELEGGGQLGCTGPLQGGQADPVSVPGIWTHGLVVTVLLTMYVYYSGGGYVQTGLQVDRAQNIWGFVSP